MKLVVCLVLIEMCLPSLVSSSSSLTIAFVTNKRSCKHDQEPLQKLWSESSSSGNLVYLQQRFNFTEDWKNKIHYKQVNNMNQTILLSRIDWLKERLQLSEDEVAIIMKRRPHILNIRSDEKLGPVLDYLADQLTLKPKELYGLVKKTPSVLGLRIESIQQNLNWIEKRIVLNDSSKKSSSQNKNVLKKVILRAPALLYLNIDNNLEPKWNMLRELLDLNDTQIAKIVTTFPSLLYLSLITTLETKLEWFQSQLELDKKELAKMIQRNPNVLGLDIAKRLKPRIVWLKKRLLLDNSSIKKVIVKHPPILYLSVISKIEPTLQWLEQRLVLTGPLRTSTGRIIEQSPHLLGMSIENNLEPTFLFFQDCIGKEEAVKLLQNAPVLLGYSLEKRLKPRYEQAKQAGIDVDDGCIRRMATYTNEKWLVSLDYQQKRVGVN